MRKLVKILIGILVLLMAGMACSLPIGNDETVVPEDENVLFFDDFSNPRSGWDRLDQTEGVTDYYDGVYRIYVNAAQVDYWANPGLDFEDVQIEVDATKAGGPDDNDFGVICRYLDNENFYFFLASSDGYYAIGKMTDGSQELLGQDQLLPSDAINLGEASNHLRADCVGSDLRFIINGSLVGSAQDSDFSHGDVGLIAGTYDTTGTDIYFDNFEVRVPGTD